LQPSKKRGKVVTLAPPCPLILLRGKEKKAKEAKRTCFLKKKKKKRRGASQLGGKEKPRPLHKRDGKRAVVVTSRKVLSEEGGKKAKVGWRRSLSG